jgi:long-chain fatty acid transport protein
MKKRIGWAMLGLLGSTAVAQAGGIDRSGQGIGILFEEGRKLELSYGRVQPSISGTDGALQATGDVGGNYSQPGFAYKADLNEKLSYAIIIDEPFGADVAYGEGLALVGTTVQAESKAATVLLRYKLGNGFAVHGGLRAEQAQAEITLAGAAYGAFSGYTASFGEDVGFGYALGASYEIPDIALRVALTYNSAVDHDFATVETGNPLAPGTNRSTTDVSIPQSVNLDAQSGIAADTLLFGQVRWVEWSALDLSPATLGSSLVTLDDVVTYTLGVGHKFNETWSGAASMTYERSIDPAVSPLAPADGRKGLSLAAIYSRDNVKVTTAINYTKLGDAVPTIMNSPVAAMSGNSVVGVGVKVGFQF